MFLHDYCREAARLNCRTVTLLRHKKKPSREREGFEN